MTLSRDTQHKNALPCAECRYAECRILFTIMLSVIMLNVVMLRVLMLNVFMLSVVAPATVLVTLAANIRLGWSCVKYSSLL